MIGGELIYSVVAESRDYPVLDLWPVGLVDGALFYSLGEDLREAMPHPLRDFRRTPGFTCLVGIALGLELLDLLGYLGLGRSLAVPTVGLAGWLGSHRDPAMPLPVAAFVDR
jgi:hypothetical protein